MTTTHPSSRYSRYRRHDVVVVGGRAAGAATALLLARAGHDVAVVDRALFPSDTLSTHGIARGGVVQLARWGLLEDVLASGAPAVRSVVFGRDGEEVARPLKERAGTDLLVAPRRQALDTLLLGAAERAGATVLTGVTVTGVDRRPDGRVSGVVGHARNGRSIELAAHFVVGADGVRSRMAGWLGARTQDCHESDATMLYTYVTGDWPAFEYHLAGGLHAGGSVFTGVFPTHDGEAALWFGGPTAALGALRSAGGSRTEALLAHVEAAAPSLAARARAGEVTAPVRGAVDLPNIVRRPIGSPGEGWALVGDAGYHRDPVTGHGITDAFRDAELLAEAVDTSIVDPHDEDAALVAYARQRDAAISETFALTRAMCAYPDPEHFVALQRQYSEVLEREAQDLADRPFPAAAVAA